MKYLTKLSQKSILENLNNKDFFKITILDSTTSTNSEARIMAENNVPEGTVIIADKQTAGRGRMGRSFSSPEGCGIYMSIILKPNFSAEKALLITTAAATSISKAIETNTEKNTGIKWVNDIYIEDKKVCGILTESVTDPKTNILKYVILGIGINITEPKDGYPNEIKNIAGAIFKYGQTPVNFRNELIAEVLNEFLKEYPYILQKKHLDYYRKKSILIGEKVDIIKLGEICAEATVIDINDDCSLSVKYNDGKTGIINSGEVSVKKKV